MFADRTGATFAEDGTPAPTPADVIGGDPEVLAQLMSLTASDLGLEKVPTLPELKSDLAAARSALGELGGELEEAKELRARRDHLEQAKDEIDRLLASAEDDAARWAWVGLRVRLDSLRAEIAVQDQGSDADDRDRALLAAADRVRELGAAWAEAAAAREELRATMGEGRPVGRSEVETVAMTPDAPPAELPELVHAWQRALDHRREAAALQNHVGLEDPAVPDDPMVRALATYDQDELWTAHAAATEANREYEQERVALGGEERTLDPEIEGDIETAHLEVVRAQRRVEKRWVPGLLMASTLSVASIGAGVVAPLLAIGALVMAIGAAVWLLAWPRKQLAAAQKAEEAQLARSGAESWLGLHLRRLDGVLDQPGRQKLEAAAHRRAVALVDWQDLVGTTPLEVVGAAEEAIRAHARTMDPSARAARLSDAKVAVADAERLERVAGDALVAAGAPYGVDRSTPPDQVEAVISSRVAAGRVARRWRDLLDLETDAEQRSAELDRFLGRLGFGDGELEVRLGWVIEATTQAKERALARGSHRDPVEVMAEIARLEKELAARHRATWTNSPDPVEPPTDPDVLEKSRLDVVSQLSTGGRADVLGAQRRLDAMSARVRDLEAGLGELSDGPIPLHKRLLAKVARTTYHGAIEESVPILLDDPLAAVGAEQRCDLLDMLLRLSEKTQVIYLTDDPVVSRWARERAAQGDVALFETEPA